MTFATRRRLTGTLVGIALIAAVSGVVWLLEPHAKVESLGVLYLLAVLPVAVVWGVVPAVIASAASVVAFGFFFVPPKYSFAFRDTDAWIALVVLLVVAVVVSELAARQRREAVALTRLQTEQAALGRVATLVAQGAVPEVVFDAVTREVGLLCEAQLARTERYEPDGTVTGVAAWSTAGIRLAVGTRFEVKGASIAALVRETKHPARLDSFSGTFGPIADEARAVGIRSSVGCPILVGGRLWGVVAASRTTAQPFPAGTESMIGEFTDLVATAISNAENESELRASRARIVAAADESRRRIERELHDGVQQHLVSLALHLRSAEHATPPELVDLKADLSRLAAGVGELLNELLELARGIHPAILNRGGIGPALKTLARRSPMPVEVDVRIRTRLSAPIEVATYYVVAEILTNVAKHAHAESVKVEVEQLDRALRVSIRDDGVGGADLARGSGLVGLRDRVEALGGVMFVESPLGVGTSVDVQLPLGE